MPELVLKGHVYYANPPLFQVNTVNKSYYCMNEKELDKLTSKLKCKYEISRLKGLGEMDEDGFRETVSDDKYRILSRIIIDDFSNASEVIRKLQGNDSTYRKQLFAERDI